MDTCSYIVAPGQGAQTPGFLTPWLELPGVADRLTAWSEVVGLDLIRYGTNADADEIRDTAVAQPLLVAAALAVGRGARRDPRPASPGTASASSPPAALAGVLTPEQALRLVRERGQAMAKAAAVTETGMTAVLGGDEDEVLAAIDEHGLTPANINGAGPDRRRRHAGAAGRLRRTSRRPAPGCAALSVAGAFHTQHMAPAVDAPAAGRRRASRPPTRGSRCCPTPTARSSASGAELLDRLVEPGQPARSAGTPAWPPWPTSASPR